MHIKILQINEEKSHPNSAAAVHSYITVLFTTHHHRHSLQPCVTICILGMPGCNGCIIKEAKTHGPRWLRVVAWGASAAEGSPVRERACCDKFSVDKLSHFAVCDSLYAEGVVRRKKQSIHSPHESPRCLVNRTTRILHHLQGYDARITIQPSKISKQCSNYIAPTNLSVIIYCKCFPACFCAPTEFLKVFDLACLVKQQKLVLSNLLSESKI